MTLNYIPDFPALEPRFDYDLVAAGLLPLLLQDSDQGATVLGIHGPWGAGKTTLMRAIQRELLKPERQNEEDRWSFLARKPTDKRVCIEFNAWKFQDREVLWRALILFVLGELKLVKLQQWKVEHPTSKDEDFADPKLIELEDKLYRAFTADEKGPWKVQWRTLIVETLTILLSVLKVGFVGTALKGSWGWLTRLFWTDSSEDKKGGKKSDEGIINHERIKELAGVLEREVVHRQVNQVQSIEQFLLEFQNLIKEFALQGRRIFVFIDDLDRCLPESALEIFEAIKLFLDARGISYVVALDRDTIKKALAVRYGRPGESEKGQLFLDPDEYIEKTISLSFDLPKLSVEDAQEIIADAKLALSDDHILRIVHALGTNPRRLRRFMNTLAVNFHIAKNCGTSGTLALDPKNLDLFLKLVLISYRYSGIFSMSRENPALLVRLQEISNLSESKGDESQDARRERQKELEKESTLVAWLAEKDDFWRAMALPPQLNNDPKMLDHMLNWFRYRTPKSKVTSEKNPIE
jgi:DNA polymerase III delta prime subunit